MLSLKEQTFTRKQYGRIFVQKVEDIAKVEDIIFEVDSFEYDYLPEDLICVFDVNETLVCVGKFEIDINKLMLACLKHDVWIWCVDGQPEPLDY